MDAAVLYAAALGASLFLGLLVMMASEELAFCPVRSVDPKLREKANIQSNIYLGVKSGSRPLPGFTTLLAALLLIPRARGPLSSVAFSWALLLSLKPQLWSQNHPPPKCMERLCWAAVCLVLAIKHYYR